MNMHHHDEATIERVDLPDELYEGAEYQMPDRHLTADENAARVQHVIDTNGGGLNFLALGEWASDTAGRGALEAIQALCEALTRKYADDDVTTWALAAIAHYHAPNLAECCADQ